MSILNLYVERDSALVAVDTDARFRDGAAGPPVSKMLVLPHINAVIACRGQGQFFVLLAMVAALPSASIDQLIAEMPEKLIEAWHTWVGQHEIFRADPDAATGTEILVVGWSERSRQMHAVVFVQERGSSDFVAREVERHYCAPWDEQLAAGPLPTSPEAMAALARRQVELVRRERPKDAAGGSLVLAVLGRKSVTTMISVEDLCAR